MMQIEVVGISFQLSFNATKLLHVLDRTNLFFFLNMVIHAVDYLLCPDISETLEMRENLHRQLQEIMSATKLTTGRRASVRLSRMGSGGADSGPHTPDGNRVGRSGNRRTLEALR